MRTHVRGTHNEFNSIYRLRELKYICILPLICKSDRNQRFICTYVYMCKIRIVQEETQVFTLVLHICAVYNCNKLINNR